MRTHKKHRVQRVDLTDLASVEPDVLREVIRETLSSLTADELAALRDRLLTDLEKAHLNVGACLFLLGIPAYVPEDLTPSDIAQLMRYVRINTPELMPRVAAPLVVRLAA